MISEVFSNLNDSVILSHSEDSSDHNEISVLKRRIFSPGIQTQHDAKLIPHATVGLGLC